MRAAKIQAVASFFIAFMAVAFLCEAPAWAQPNRPDLTDDSSSFASIANPRNQGTAQVQRTASFTEHLQASLKYSVHPANNNHAGIAMQLYEPDSLKRKAETYKMKQSAYA